MNSQEDWKLVPVEPTEEMLRAGSIDLGCRRDCNLGSTRAREAYAAMLSSSPCKAEVDRRELAKTAGPQQLEGLVHAEKLDHWAFEMERSAAAMRPLDRQVAEGNDRIARDLRAAAKCLTLLSSPKGMEPVAWRYRSRKADGAWGDWYFTSAESERLDALTYGAQVQPLYVCPVEGRASPDPSQSTTDQTGPYPSDHQTRS